MVEDNVEFDFPWAEKRRPTPKALVTGVYGSNYAYLEIKPPVEIDRKDAIALIEEYSKKLNDLSGWRGLTGKIGRFFASNGQEMFPAVEGLPYFEEMKKRVRSNLPPSIDPESNYYPGNYIYGILGNQRLGREEKVRKVKDILLYLSSLPESPFAVYIVIEDDKNGKEAVKKAIESLKERYEAELHKIYTGRAAINRYTLLSSLANIVSKLPLAKRYAEELRNRAVRREFLEKAAEYAAEVLVSLAERYYGSKQSFKTSLAVSAP